MPTIIDTFILEFDLDPSKLTKGQKEVLRGLKETKDAAADSAKNIEASGQRAGDFFEKLGGKVLGLFSLFVGGRGAKEFTQFVTQADVAAGRLSKNLNAGVGDLSSWFSASERAGGSAQATANSFQSFSDQIQNLKATGDAGNLIGLLNALTVASGRQINLNKPLTETYVDLAYALNKMAQQDRAQAAWTGRQILGDEALVSLMIDKGEAISGLTARQRELNGMTKEDVEASNELNKSWQDATQSATALGRTILTILTPALTTFLNRWTDIFAELKRGEIISPDSLLGRLLGKSRNYSLPSETRSSADAPGGGISSSNNETEAYIREAARKRGIDPDVAVGVWKSEGKGGYVGDRGSSFGPYQLHYGNVASGGMAVGGLGDEFTRKTGLDARDPKTWQQQVDFSLDQAAKGGWTPWHGWRGPQWAGIGASAGAGIGAASSGGNGGTTTNTTTIGTLTVNTQATDAAGIARDIKPELERNSFAAQANYGPQ